MQASIDCLFVNIYNYTELYHGVTKTKDPLYILKQSDWGCVGCSQSMGIAAARGTLSYESSRDIGQWKE